jgi:hypothetical protein
MLDATAAVMKQDIVLINNYSTILSMETKTTIIILATVVTLGIFSALDINAQQGSTSPSSSNGTTTVTFEGTAMSTVDSLPGHQGHQAVIVLPSRADGKIWVGTISWTASKPVELRLLYDYDSGLKTDAIHGKPITAPQAYTTEAPHVPVGEVAISLIKQSNGPAAVPSFNSGSMSFVAKAVAFHTINGTRFTVTYAVDAAAKQLTR